MCFQEAELFIFKWVITTSFVPDATYNFMKHGTYTGFFTMRQKRKTENNLNLKIYT